MHVTLKLLGAYEKACISEGNGRFLSRAQDMRVDADYDAFTRFDALAASDLLRDVETFVGEAEALVKRLSEEDSERH